MIRTRETVKRTVRTKETNGALTLKEAPTQSPRQLAIRKGPHMAKGIPVPGHKAGALPYTAKKNARAAMAAKQTAVISMQRATARMQQSAVATVRFKRMVEAAARTVKSAFAALAAGGGAFFVVLILIVGVVGGAFSYSSSQSSEALSAEVLSYTATIQRYASEYGIPEYVSVIQAIMMQESGGRGTDPMQSSECPYNIRYPNSPGAIQDP